MNLNNLDHWDYQLIQAFKNFNWNQETLKRIWAERCAVQVSDVRMFFIIQHLFKLILQLGLVDFKFIFNLAPENNWQTRNSDQQKEPCDYWTNVLYAIANVLCMAEIIDLPGYQKFIETKKSFKKSLDITVFE